MRSFGALGLLALAALACATPGPRNSVAPGHAGAPGAKRFLVCAPNTVLSLPAELQEGTGPVREAIEAYLAEHGREAEAMDLFESRQHWADAVASAKQAGEIEKTPSYFAKALAGSYAFDAIVMPSILLQERILPTSDAEWDGVRREIRIVNAPSRRIQKRMSPRGVQAGVTSLHVMVFSRDGERLLEGRGGLEFAHDVDLGRVRRTGGYDLAFRGDLFADRALLRDGVAAAFDPYLPRRAER